ncbi:MAG: hypothetical protein U9Q37_10295, partial [Euryarchaeota archaeon]|nr:hypothetical protein [Euryarchaeota archaeon]
MEYIREFWDIARWCESERESQTVAWYQMEIMGTREAQYALPVVGVCVIKPINGKILQKGVL